MSFSIKPATKLKGSLEVICGSMFSGKTEELMKRLKRAEFANKRVLTIKHHIDNRTQAQCILSHDGQERSAFPVSSSAESIARIKEIAGANIDVIGIDEIQFFPKDILKSINWLISNGKRVIVSGLDLDFRGEPFGIIPELMALADDVTKLRAVCSNCGKDAHYSQRIINGKPARYADPIILVGAAEKYEARCRDCFVIDGEEVINSTQSFAIQLHG